METARRFTTFGVAGFNRTDTEWKLPAFRLAPLSFFDSIEPIRNGNPHKNFISSPPSRIQSNRYGMETAFDLAFALSSTIQSNRYGMETGPLFLFVYVVMIQSNRYGMETSPPLVVARPRRIQSNRYGMETSLALRTIRHRRFNRTDTEWKLVDKSRIISFDLIQSNRYGMETLYRYHLS